MKRCWFGLGLLILMLVGGLLVTRTMGGSHSRLAHQLEAVQESALAEDWDTAQALFQNAKAIWLDRWHFSAAFSDHEPMEEIDGLFAQAEVYLRCREKEALAATCGELAQMANAMGEAHALNWWNLL